MPSIHTTAPPALHLRQDFPMFGNVNDDGLAYLDNAATTQKPKKVLDALVGYYSETNSNVGRGYYRLSHEATDRYEQARATVQRFIGASNPDEIIFTQSTTDSINLVAEVVGQASVGHGDRVLVSAMEHNSNLLPWHRLCERVGAELVVAPTAASGRIEIERFKELLDERVKIVAVAHVSNVLGTLNPVAEIASLAHGVGATVVVDGAQAAAHIDIDVGSLDVDFYAFSGHKAYGPMGIGVLYGRASLLDDIEPYRVGGGTVKAVSLGATVRYLPAPARLEAGTPNVGGAIALASAIDYMNDPAFRPVHRYEAELVRALVEGVAKRPSVSVVGDPMTDPTGIVSLVVDGIHPYDVGGHLDGHGLAVRCGVHCASVFLDALGLLGTIRISFAAYNTHSEVERLLRALDTVEAGEWTNERPDVRFV